MASYKVRVESRVGDNMKTAFELNDDELREVYRKIAARERPHGGFLISFAEAVVRADQINFAILSGAARMFVVAFNLESYAVEPPWEV